MRKQKFPHLLGSKWTAQEKIEGWRHFEVVNRKNQGQWVFAELVAACAPDIRFWINARTLKNKKLWSAGWRSLSETADQDSSVLRQENPAGLTSSEHGPDASKLSLFEPDALDDELNLEGLSANQVI